MRTVTAHQSVGDQLGKLHRLVAVETRVTDRLVTIPQIRLGQGVGTTQTFRDIVAGKLDVHPTRSGAQFLVDVEETVDLGTPVPPPSRRSGR